MSKEQIEEIKNVLINTCKRIRSLDDDIMQDQYAKALYNAGYRKQSEGEWRAQTSTTNERKAELFDGAMSWIYSRLAYEQEDGYEEALEKIGFSDKEIDEEMIRIRGGAE